MDNLNTNKQKKQQRDQIISGEIYKMFSTIRDHQSASVKARGEINALVAANRRLLRKSGSWSYSSGKRHVIAKVMELPFAEDVNQLARRVGLIYSGSGGALAGCESVEEQMNQLLSLTTQQQPTEATNERVFVRIDDFLSKQVFYYYCYCYYYSHNTKILYFSTL